MRNKSELIVTLKLNCEISLWQAIKLRIAGKNFRTIAMEILEKVKNEVVN